MAVARAESSTHLCTLASMTMTATAAARDSRNWVVMGIGAGLVTVAVVVRALMSLRGYLLGDDFAVRYRAHSVPWSLDYAFQPYNDHLSPVGYSLQWVLQWAFPGSHIALVLATSVLFALSLAGLCAFAWLATQRLIALWLTTVAVGLGLFTFEVGTWWCTSLYSMTYLAFVALAIWGLARNQLRGGSSLLVAAGLLGAALSDSKGFLAVLLVFGIAAGVDLTGGGPLGLRAAWRRWQPLWWFGLALAVGSLALSAATTSGVQGTLTPGRVMTMMRDLWVVNIAPAVFGGPWWWSHVPGTEWEPVRVLPATPQLLGWRCLLLCGVGLWFIVRRRPAIAWFVPYALAYCLITTLIPVIGRAGTNLSSAAYRYTYDVVAPVTVLVVLALVPMWWQHRRTGRQVRLVIIGLVVSMGVSTWVPAAAWGRNEAKDYVRSAVQGFSTIPESQIVMPQRVPEDLVPGLLWQYANTEAVLSPQPGAPEFGDTAYGTLFGFAADGSLQTQDVLGPTSLPGPDPDCGYAVTDVPRSIPLDSDVIAWSFLARVAYFSANATTLNVAIGGQIQTVDLPASDLTSVYFPVMGPGRDVLVSVGTPGVTACVTDLRIGNRVVAGTDEVVEGPPGDPALMS